MYYWIGLTPPKHNQSPPTISSIAGWITNSRSSQCPLSKFSRPPAVPDGGSRLPDSSAGALPRPPSRSTYSSTIQRRLAPEPAPRSFGPASCSFRMPTLCSSLNRPLLMPTGPPSAPPLQPEALNFSWLSFFRAGQRSAQQTILQGSDSINGWNRSPGKPECIMNRLGVRLPPVELHWDCNHVGEWVDPLPGDSAGRRRGASVLLANSPIEWPCIVECDSARA